LVWLGGCRFINLHLTTSAEFFSTISCVIHGIDRIDQRFFFLSGSLRILHVPSHLCVTSCFGAGRSWHSYSRHISVIVHPHLLVTMSTEFFSTISCAHVRFFFSRGILILATSLEVSALISSWCPVSPHLCHLLRLVTSPISRAHNECLVASQFFSASPFLLTFSVDLDMFFHCAFSRDLFHCTTDY
jgi:hypothetical protein